MTQANQADFFGDGTAAPVDAGGQLTPEQLDEAQRRRNAAVFSDRAATTSAINNNPNGDYMTGRQVVTPTGPAPVNGYLPRPNPGSFASGIVPTLKAISKDPVTAGILAAPYGVLGAGAALGGLASGGAGTLVGGAPTAAAQPFLMASPHVAGTATGLAAGVAPAAAAGGITAGQVIGGVGAAGSVAAMAKGFAGGAPKVNAPQVGADFAGSAGGGGGAGGAAGSQSLGYIADQRDRAAQDMFAYGDQAQSRTAPQAHGVAYTPPSQVTAPKLAPAAQASMGSYGGSQTIQAQQATANTAQNQAGFLGNTAAQARGIADLDMGQSNESRGAQQQNLAGIQGFLDNGPGPSMAQQQLRMAQEQSLGDALSLARSGRGNAAGNMKNAISENAATNAQTNQQAALLRAQEGDMWQQRQLQGLGLQQSGATSMRGQDLGAAQAQGQQALSREQLAGNIDVSRAGLEQGLAQFNAGQQNQVGMQNAQLGTEAGIQQAGLANALNIAQGNAGTNVNLQNAEQTNLNSRLQGQMGLDASSTNAQLSNALNIAQGNSNTAIDQANLQAKLDTSRANDAFTNDMYGYGMGAYDQQINAARGGLDDDYRYKDLAAEIAMRDADRQAGIATGNADRSQRRDAALIGGGASVLQTLAPFLK